MREVASSGLGLSAPRSALARLLLASIVGLLIGLAGAVLMNRKSETVYGVPSVEAATLLPAIAEIPFINVVGKRRYDVLAQAVPASGSRRRIEAFARRFPSCGSRTRSKRAKQRARNVPTSPAF